MRLEALIFLVSVYQSWMVDRNITNFSGMIKSAQTGLQTIPTQGWLFAYGGRFVGSDDTLHFIYN